MPASQTHNAQPSSGREVIPAHLQESALEAPKLALRLRAIEQERAELQAVNTTLLQKEMTAEDLAQFKIHGDKIDALDTQRDLILRELDSKRKSPAETAHALANNLGAANVDPNCGFKGLGEFMFAVHRATARGPLHFYDPRLNTVPYQAAAPSDALTHRETGGDDGWMVPPAMAAGIWDAVFADDGDILGLLTWEPTMSNVVQLVADETTPWGSAGIKAYRIDEGDTFTASKLSTQTRRVEVHKYGALVAATEELMADAPRLESRLQQRAGQALRWLISEDCVNGLGTHGLKGWMKAACLVSVAKESGQAAATLKVANIFKMYSRLLDTGGARPFWFANRDIVPQLGELTIANLPVWTGFNAGMREQPSGVLLGYPIRWSEHCETLGTKGDLHLVNLSGFYGVRRTGGIDFASSIHLWFDQDKRAFRWTFRVGGEPLLTAAVSPAKGSNTKSHFVVLDTRA